MTLRKPIQKRGQKQMPKQSPMSKPSPTSEENSSMPSMMQQEQPSNLETTELQPEDSPMLSDEELSQATSIGLRLAMSDSLSMLKRRNTQLRMLQK
jgi:hypothetical protein